MKFLVNKLAGANNLVTFYLWLAVIATYHSFASWKMLVYTLATIGGVMGVCYLFELNFWVVYGYTTLCSFVVLLILVCNLYRLGGLKLLREIYCNAFTFNTK